MNLNRSIKLLPYYEKELRRLIINDTARKQYVGKQLDFIIGKNLDSFFPQHPNDSYRNRNINSFYRLEGDLTRDYLGLSRSIARNEKRLQIYLDSIQI